MEILERVNKNQAVGSERLLCTVSAPTLTVGVGVKNRNSFPSVAMEYLLSATLPDPH